jgi:ERCC4-type nuclease
MNIVVDIREAHLYDKLLSIITENNKPSTITIETKPLLLGDITLEIKDTNEVLILFERKSLRDLLASITDGRYAEQSHRLIYTSNIHTHNIVYIIEGMYSQLRNDNEKKRCLSAMTSLSYYKGFSVFRTCSIFETAEWIYATATKIQKEREKGGMPAFLQLRRNPSGSANDLEETLDSTEIEVNSIVSVGVINSDEVRSLEFPRSPSAPKGTCVTSHPGYLTNTQEEPVTSLAKITPYCQVVHKVKKDNITPENIGEIILCTIPGISSTSAIEIMKHYSSFSHFMEEIKSNPGKLEEIYLSTNGKKRKLGKNIIKNIIRYLALK